MIVNADDLGYTATTTQAILEAFDDGLVSSATIMPTMAGFEEAAARVRERELLGHVGVHLTLTEGVPLTEPLRRCGALCDADGRLRQWRGRSAFVWGPVVRAALAGEVRAQIARCRDHGLPLTHADSHHHVHNEPVLIGIVVRAVRELGVPYLRLSRNCGPMSLPRRLYKFAVNARIRRSGLAGTRRFGDFGAYEAFARTGASTADLSDFELVVHPIFAGDGSVIDRQSGTPLAEMVRRLDLSTALVSYAGLPIAPRL